MKSIIIQKIILIALICVLVSTLFGCQNTPPTETEIPEATPEPVPYVERVQLNTFNEFAIELLKNTRQDGGNLVISPITVGIAMTMFNIGALGETQAGIQEALGLELGEAYQLTESAKEVMDTLLDQQGLGFNNGFALYINEGPSVREKFAVSMEDFFKLDLNFEDFADDEKRLEVHINDWASEVTSSSSRITTVFAENTLPHDDSAFMLSVSSAHCEWDTAFNLANTRTLPFTTDDGMALAVPTLRGQMTIGFYEDDDVTVGFLPLAGEKTTLAIFIPPNDDTIEKFLGEFTGEDIILWKALAYKKEKWIYLPKVNFATPNTLELSGVLSKMGASDMFNAEKADFTNLGNNFHLDRFYQVSQIKITEKGKNESNITAVDITRANNNGEDFFIVNRSFVFALLDEKTGAIMMIGTLADPIKP